MSDITIPPEALRAARLAYGDLSQDDPIEAALRAGIAAWPGMFYHPARLEEEACIFLPLPQENNNAES